MNVRGALLLVIAAWLTLASSMWCPVLDPDRPPVLDLGAEWSRWILWLTMTGGRVGAAVVGTSLLLVLLWQRPDRGAVQWRRCRTRAVFWFCVIVGGIAWLNEHVTKPAFAVPRPSICEIFQHGGQQITGTTVEQFYQISDRSQRRQVLRSVFASGRVAIRLLPEIRDHWAYEVGFSFPSGHALISMLYATLFSLLSAEWLPRRKSRWFALLVFWAVGVSLSRAALRVHRPVDITAGGLLGLVVGLIAFWLIQRDCRSPSLTMTANDASHNSVPADG